MGNGQHPPIARVDPVARIITIDSDKLSLHVISARAYDCVRRSQQVACW